MATQTMAAAPTAKTIADQGPLLAVDDARTLYDLERCFTGEQLEHYSRLLRGWKGEGKPPLDDVLTFIWRCRATGLDPWLGQIVAIYRNDRNAGRQVMAVQTTVKGFVVCALRSGLLVSIGKPVFSENIVTVKKGERSIRGPEWAEVTVVRRNLKLGIDIPFTFRAKLAEFARDTAFWEDSPEHMLGPTRALGHAVELGWMDLLSGVSIFDSGDDDHIGSNPEPLRVAQPKPELGPRAIPPGVPVKPATAGVAP